MNEVVENDHIPEDLEDLINLRVAGEERLACAHLGKDGTDGPHVDSGGVLAATKQNFWGSVPQRDNLKQRSLSKLFN